MAQDNRTGFTTYRFDHDTLERLLATLNSYLAHLAKASTHRLLAALLDEHPWLTAYFHMDAHKAKRTWRPPSGFSRLAEEKPQRGAQNVRPRSVKSTPRPGYKNIG